jgi:hypothetical protein
MRLLRAELRKLNRPLLWGVTFASALFCVLLAVGGAHNARQAVNGAADQVPSCATIGVPAGPACTTVQAAQRARIAQGRAEQAAAVAHTAAQLHPAAAGAEAAGLMASLPGALALPASGHVGGSGPAGR